MKYRFAVVRHLHISATLLMLMCLLQESVAADAAASANMGARVTQMLRNTFASAGFVPMQAAEPYIWEGQAITLGGVNRSFNFSGDKAFINLTSGQPDLATIQADGQIRSGATIAADGFAPYVTRQTDPLFPGMGQALKVILEPGHALTAGSWRTQLASYPLLPYKTYRWLLTFRLDDQWDMEMPAGGGLLWQLKGHPKSGQWGNPVLALNLVGKELFWQLSYPSAALQSPPGSRIYWTSKDYDKSQVFPRRNIVPGRYYTIEFEMFADERPAQFGGHGYFKAWFEGVSWVSYTGPTLHPDQTAPHYMAFGWYQWEGRPTDTRVVWWLRNEAYVKR